MLTVGMMVCGLVTHFLCIHIHMPAHTPRTTFLPSRVSCPSLFHANADFLHRFCDSLYSVVSLNVKTLFKYISNTYMCVMQKMQLFSQSLSPPRKKYPVNGFQFSVYAVQICIIIHLQILAHPLSVSNDTFHNTKYYFPNKCMNAQFCSRILIGIM